MTLRNLLPAIALLIGIALGVFGANSFSSSAKTNTTQPNRIPAKSTARNASDAVSSSPSGTPLAGNAIASASSFGGSAEELLELSGIAYSGANSAEYVLTVESLTESQVAALLEEIESSYSNDDRSWQVRQTLMRRWATLSPDRALSAAREIANVNVRSELLYAVASVIALQDPERAIALAEDIEGEREKKTFYGAIAANVASKDPERALELLSLSGDYSTHHYHTVFQSWMKNDPTAAIEAAKKIKGQQAKQQAERAIAIFLARESPEKGWAYAEALSGNSRNSALGQVLFQIASDDPQDAIAFLDQMPRGQKRDNALSQFVSGWMNQDPDGARSWIKTLPEPEQAKAIEGSLWNLTQSDIQETVTLIESFKPSAQTANLYANLVSNWAQSDPDAAQRWVKQLPPGSARQSAQSSLLNRLAQSDPAKAIEFLEGETITDQNRNQVTQVAASLARNDPDAAFAWLDSLEVTGSAHKELITNTISQLAYQDGPKAASYALTIEDKSTRKNAIANLIRGWGNQDREAAKTWIDTHLTSEERLGAYDGLLSSISYQEPLGAKALLEEVSQGLTPEEMKTHFKGKLAEVAGNWARNDPNAAAAWAQTQPEGDERSRMVASVVGQWAEFDSTGAANFVLTLAEGKERDGAIKNLVSDLRQWEPESAFLWANSISDGDQRKRQIRNAVNSWSESDPVAAREAVLTADIPEEVRTNMLKDLDSE